MDIGNELDDTLPGAVFERGDFCGYLVLLLSILLTGFEAPITVVFCRRCQKVRHPATARRQRLIQIQKYAKFDYCQEPHVTQTEFSCVSLSCLAFRRGLAISRQPILRRAQAREGEAEKL